jgi:hypothetical protein
MTCIVIHDYTYYQLQQTKIYNSIQSSHPKVSESTPQQKINEEVPKLAQQIISFL